MNRTRSTCPAFGGAFSAVVFLVLAALLAAPGGVAAGNAGFTDSFMIERCTFRARGANPYFILEPGYKLILEGEDGKELVRLEITVLNETKMINGVRTRVVEEFETADSEVVEISRNHFAICQETNSVFYFGEDVDIYEDGEVVSHDGAWKAGEGGARPGIIMPGTLLLGARYFQEVAPDVALDQAEILSLSEELETPEGGFEDVLWIRETTPLEPNAKDNKFYAPGVGIIQDGVLQLVWHSPGF